MKIGIISDTHGDVVAWNKIWELDFSTCDLIIHAGDVLYHGPRNPVKNEYLPASLATTLNESKVPMLIAEGNCDAFVDQMVLETPINPSPLYTQIDGLSYLIHHGHNIDQSKIIKMVDRYKANIFITGHTHVPVLKKFDKFVYINPGSCSLPKNQPQMATYIILEDRVVYLKDMDGKIVKKLPISNVVT